MGFHGDFHRINGIYPLVNIQKAIEHGPVEIVDLPIENGDVPYLPEGKLEVPTIYKAYVRPM